MLLQISVLLLGLIVVVVVIHYFALFLFLRALKHKEWQTPGEGYTPKTMVVLGLRGADPFLGDNIRRLLSQDYPDYAVRLVVDHPRDPALPVVTQTVKAMKCTNVEILIPDKHPDNRSLKCNSLVFALETLDPSYEIVAFLDADTQTHPQWLRDLVEPFSDPRFMASTGHRWYIPSQMNAGSVIRYLWNAAAVVQLYLYRAAWGGTMAIRRTLLEKSELLQCWGTSLSDDASLPECVKHAHGKVAFVPSLFMVNRETTSLATFLPWVTRQLFMMKTYHAQWRIIASQGFLITIPLTACFILFVVGLARQDLPVTLCNTASLVIYWLGVFCTLPFMERGIRRILRQRNEAIPAWNFFSMLKTVLLVTATQFVYTLSLAKVFFIRRVHWRGVEYEVLPGKKVHMIEYKPFQQQKQGTEHTSIY